ncbi:MAG: type II toxin-antitoxin system RelE/ParE family toxin [Pseudomonadota bacterium]
MKGYGLEYRPQATSDLKNIFDWIAKASGPQTSLAYVQRIEAFCQRIPLAPFRGTRRDDLADGVRIIGFERRVSIAFLVEDEVVVILRILYGGRDLAAELV